MHIFTQTGLRWIWIAIVVLVLDQVTKLAILDSFQLYERVNYTSFFNLVYVQNFGAAFSFLSDAGGWQRYFFTGIAIAAVVLLSVWMYKTPADKRLMPIGFSLILGGALGNLYDRISYGYVVDFLDFYYQNWHWPAFNVADMGIVVGAGLVLLDSFINQEDEQKSNPST
ncbi:lipoprotein signal peptidase [Saccharobesus litoralis]|uniref:Lipoprotein signal peptidase n=1 Tax=Saccharobesus litoralis TaxID=2172099 RepID=A0A2S0VWF3_9ALTE|nr:signal peptidase II [Saccharobesus litoralis]AWB68541.1 lipoprotein signal peptidase [Saccharobesus litoralis]